MRSRRAKLGAGIAAVVAVAMAAGPASATLFCEISATSDGFAALRALPDRKSRLVMKVAPDLMVQLDPTKEPPEKAKDWLAVVVVKGEPKRTLGRGWIHKSLIKPDSCG